MNDVLVGSLLSQYYYMCSHRRCGVAVFITMITYVFHVKLQSIVKLEAVKELFPYDSMVTLMFSNE